MRLRSVSTLAAAAAIALILAPGRVAADPLLHSYAATNEFTGPGPDTVLLFSDILPLTPSATPDWTQDASGSSSLETGDSNDGEDFLTPVFQSLGDGFPL